MNNTKFVENLAGKYEPQLPFDQLVIEMNKIYHSFEAEIYDTYHSEIYDQLPSLWQEMSKIAEHYGAQALRILNFGCGTGFEAQQLLKNIPSSRIAALICYDPSSEMLEQCRAKITPLFPNTIFCSSEEELITNAHYTLFATNSLLHHLPDVTLTISNLLPLLDPHTVWLAGHEPSLRFYKNRECVKNLEAYQQKRPWLLSNYLRLLKRRIRIKSNPYTKTAREAVHRGLFKQQPPTHVVDRLVDFHVAHSIEEINVGRGFDVSSMQQDFQASWKLIWQKTYSFMGPFYDGELKGRWARSCQELAHRFPNDGANFCTIWQRV